MEATQDSALSRLFDGLPVPVTSKTGPIRLCLSGTATISTRPDSSEICFSWVPDTTNTTFNQRFTLSGVFVTPAATRRYITTEGTNDTKGIRRELDLPISGPISGLTVPAFLFVPRSEPGHQARFGESGTRSDIISEPLIITDRAVDKKDFTLGEPIALRTTIWNSATRELEHKAYALTPSKWVGYDVNPSTVPGGKLVVDGKTVTDNRFQVTFGESVRPIDGGPVQSGTYHNTWVELWLDEPLFTGAGTAWV